MSSIAGGFPEERSEIEHAGKQPSAPGFGQGVELGDKSVGKQGCCRLQGESTLFGQAQDGATAIVGVALALDKALGREAQGDVGGGCLGQRHGLTELGDGKQVFAVGQGCQGQRLGGRESVQDILPTRVPIQGVVDPSQRDSQSSDVLFGFCFHREQCIAHDVNRQKTDPLAGGVWRRILRSRLIIRLRFDSDALMFAALCSHLRLLVLPAVLLFVACGQQGAVEIREGYINAPPAGAMMAAGFLTIDNGTRDMVTVSGVELGEFKRVEVHETRMQDGMMRMRPRPELEVAPGKTVTFAPGGLHLMLMQPTRPLEAGEVLEGSVLLRKADGSQSRVPVKLEVRSPAGMHHGAGH